MAAIKDDDELVDRAEANIRADRRSGEITEEQFRKEMLIAARYRFQIEAQRAARKRKRSA